MRDYISKKVKTEENQQPPKKISIIKAISYLVKGLLIVGILGITVLSASNIPDFLDRPIAYEKISFYGNSILPNNVLLQAAGISESESWWDFDAFSRSIALVQHPWVESATIRKRIDFGLDFIIKEVSPVAYLQTTKNLYLLGKDLRVLPLVISGKGWNLPIIAFKKEFSIDLGELLPFEKFKGAVQLMELLTENEVIPLSTVSEIDVTDPFNIELVTMPHGIKVKLGSANFEEKIKNLDNGLFLLEKEKLNIRYIDLRYENAIVFRRKV